jgi:hypothetical protein
VHGMDEGVQVRWKSGISRKSCEFSLSFDIGAFRGCHVAMRQHSVVRRLSLLFPMLLLLGTTQSPALGVDEKRPLFDVFPMADWGRVGGQAQFELLPPPDGGVGPTLLGKGPIDRNGFLVTPRPLGDFRLSVEVRIGSADNPLGEKMNSGIQLRSQVVDGTVAGLQIEIDPSDRAWSGGVYHERGRGWLASLEGNEAGRRAFRRGDWNLYEIECVGPRISTKVNGVPCAEWFDGVESGLLAFQVHGGPACEVLFRAPVLEELGQHEWRAFAMDVKSEMGLEERRVDDDTTSYPITQKCAGVRASLLEGTQLRLLDEHGKDVLGGPLTMQVPRAVNASAAVEHAQDNARTPSVRELRVEVLWRDGRGALVVDGVRQQVLTLSRVPALLEVSAVGQQRLPELLVPREIERAPAKDSL